MSTHLHVPEWNSDAAAIIYHSGLVITCPTAVHKIPGSNALKHSARACHNNHCKTSTVLSMGCTPLLQCL